MSEITCDYAGCEYTGEVIEIYDGWFACPKHEDMVHDQSGYCSNSCCFGYGCDDSC